MLKLDLKPGQSISVGGAIITLEKKYGQVATLAIDADKSVPITRVKNHASSVAADHGIMRSEIAA